MQKTRRTMPRPVEVTDRLALPSLSHTATTDQAPAIQAPPRVRSMPRVDVRPTTVVPSLPSMLTRRRQQQSPLRNGGRMDPSGLSALLEQAGSAQAGAEFASLSPKDRLRLRVKSQQQLRHGKSLRSS